MSATEMTIEAATAANIVTVGPEKGSQAVHDLVTAYRANRRTGGVGACATPSRVWKGQKMPGHMGNERKTVQNLKVVQVRKDDNVILVSGPVPGAKGSYVVVRPAKKKNGK